MSVSVSIIDEDFTSVTSSYEQQVLTPVRNVVGRVSPRTSPSASSEVE